MTKTNNNWMSRDSRIITLFFFLELFIIAVVFVLTFVPQGRKTVLGRNVGSRAEAIKKGFGYYSDPEFGDCFTETGNCETPGTRFSYQRCIPNFGNGDGYGTGCVDKDGIFTYNMIITEEGCNQQCYSETISLHDNINTTKQNNGKVIVTSVGTHQLLDKETGVNMSDYFIGDFDLADMTYDLKNCIIDIKKYAGFKERQYTCEPGTVGGVNGCVYACGTDPTLNFNETVTQNTEQFLGSIPFPFYISGGTPNDDGTVTGGTKVFVCKDIQDNNSVEMLNHGQTVPASFVFPDKCYNHVNLIDPPTVNAGVLVFSENTPYSNTDRYIYVLQENDKFYPYFQQNYNYLNNLRTYVKIISNQETMLLSRMYDGNGGLESINNDDDVVVYIAMPKTVFNQADISNSSTLSFSGSTSFTGISFINNISAGDTTVQNSSFFFLPIYLFSDLFHIKVLKLEGSYVYDEPNGILHIRLQNSNPGIFYLVISYDDEPQWVPRIFKFDSNSSGDGTISNNTTPHFKPPKIYGVLNYYQFVYSPYSVTLNNAGTKNFTLNLTDLMITGSMFVDSFDLKDQIPTEENISLTVDSEATFYIKGTPSSGTNVGKTGFYYPLSLSKINPDQTYTEISFKEYGLTEFYLENGGTQAGKNVDGSLSNYDFLRGVGSVNILNQTTQINYGGASPYIATYWSTPEILMPGRGYNPGTYYNIGETNSIIYVQSIQDSDNSLLEVVRNGDSLFDGFEMDLILEGQLRKSVEIDDQNNYYNYDISIFPEKILQVERDFGNFLGPYTQDEDGKRTFVCTDSSGTPLTDGILIRFNVGETITALVQDYNFNTKIPSDCGNILVEGEKICRENRESEFFSVSDTCKVFNPDGNYEGIGGFLESGYILSDDNQLFCYVDGIKKDNSRCTKPFLTDYVDPDRFYDIGEEVIVNNGDIKSYISLKDNNFDLPGSDNWATFSLLHETNFNAGQYFGFQETYITADPGSIFMDMGYQIKYLKMLRYRQESEYVATKSWGSQDGMDFDQFKVQFNVVTPYLGIPTNNDVQFTMINSDAINPSIKVELPNVDKKLLEDKIFLEENYLNILIWYMSSYAFLTNTVAALGNVEFLSFVTLGDNNVTVADLNTNTDLPLYNL